MTEHAYIRSVHDQIRKQAPAIYIWKINDPYQGGVADAYYSWRSDLWIEYKFLKSLPKRDSTVLDFGLSPLQKKWLRDRHGEGRRVSVIVGSPDGSLILPGVSWDGTITRADYLKSTVDKKMIAAYILREVSMHIVPTTQEGLHEQPHDHRARQEECSTISGPLER